MAVTACDHVFHHPFILTQLCHSLRVTAVISYSSCYLPSLHEGEFEKFSRYHEKGSNLG